MAFGRLTSVGESIRWSTGELSCLVSLLYGLVLSEEGNDDWNWSISIKDGFSVNCLSKVIEKHVLTLGCLGRVLKWNNWVPKKLNVFYWRVINERLPHLANLDKQGIDVHLLLCSLCKMEFEDGNHILYNCRKVKPLWLKCFDWWNIPMPPSYSPDTLMGAVGLVATVLMGIMSVDSIRPSITDLCSLVMFLFFIGVWNYLLVRLSVIVRWG
ncbi:hypothetical protein CTI12_AA161160 [Artemisia annua]|uniref:Reverse transcriptase zinc-binding domain-containing protein n=1 Tax=Artemisia annua TaxID=35608 RepID=A0A2U1PER0_ARTAN|nr:hypothetical protein CTI12_AA161160 [Artemisia annua]